MSLLHATIPPAGTIGAIDEPQWAQDHIVSALNNQVLFALSSSITGSIKFTWNDTTETLSLGTSASGATLQTLSNATAGPGGSFTLQAGMGGPSGGGGGSFIENAGNAQSGNNTGGNFVNAAGNGSGSGSGGGFTLGGGSGGATGAGGSLVASAGNGAGGNTAGATLTLAPGAQNTTTVCGDTIVTIAANQDAAHSGNYIVQDWALDNSLVVDPFGNVQARCVVTPANADTNGFFYIPAIAGAPTGTPAHTSANYVPMRYDTTNHKLWVYDGTWKGVVLA